MSLPVFTCSDEAGFCSSVREISAFTAEDAAQTYAEWDECQNDGWERGTEEWEIFVKDDDGEVTVFTCYTEMEPRRYVSEKE